MTDIHEEAPIKGKWIRMPDEEGYECWVCSECGIPLNAISDPEPYCPKCGHPMQTEA